MIVDGVDSAPHHSDICIVGAGPVGLALAFRCAELDLSVLVIEAGNNGHTGRAGSLGPISFCNHHHVESVDSVSSGIGGTSRLWGGRCVTMDDLDFAVRRHVPHSGWPIPHSELSTHYEEALRFLNCGPLAALPQVAPGGSVTLDSLEQWSAEPDLGRAYREQLSSTPNITVIKNATATRIALSGGSGEVRHLDVRAGTRSFKVRAEAYVLAGGGLENTRLLLAAQRTSPQLFGGAHGPLGRFYAGHLTGYLSVIEFDNPRYDNLLRFEKSPAGNPARRRLAIQPDVQRANRLLNSAFWLESLSISDPNHGSGALSLVYIVFALTGLYPRIAKGLAPAAVASQTRRYDKHWRNISGDSGALHGAAKTLVQMLVRRFRRQAGAVRNPRRRYLLRYHAEQAPDPKSRVSLDPQDRSLLPGLQIDLRFGDQDFNSIVRSHQLIDQWLRTNRIGHLDYIHRTGERSNAVRAQALDGYHQIGLTRMSTNPQEGVVNPDCRVHDVDNLYVAGSSIFPTGGQANPTLPAVALALRLAEHLARVKRRQASSAPAPDQTVERAS